MKRIDNIYEKLKELSQDAGVPTEVIAAALGLSRANVSSDLNQLCEMGKAAKEGVRPVLYKAVSNETLSNTETVLDELAQQNPSLFSAAEQAKAAILYPPQGMHILILGETGVGKSMFATLIHQYAVQMNRMESNSPLIVFNCADYANNPQLLLSQLFGTKKGAYTGADADKAGLIQKADGGILFLDEVHRLPPEGQEMFFTFMDTGSYRRLGETDAGRTAQVLIIAATTEEPGSSLLKTFTRRIPMTIRMPNLNQRSMEERFNLINQFFREEAFRLGKPISVSLNSMKSFLSYRCPNNVGQLKTDIQLACAKAYADFISNKKDAIKINSAALPGYIREGLYSETGHRQLWNKLIDINKRYCIFDSSAAKILFEEDEKNIYDMIDLRVHELKSQGAGNDQIERQMAMEIKDYFSAYLGTVNRNNNISNLEGMVGATVLRVVEEIIKFSEDRLQKTFNQSIHQGLAVHIANSIERIKQNKKIVNPQLNKLRTEYSAEFATAVDCLKIISRVLDIDLPIDEAGFLVMFFIYNDPKIRKPENNVKVIIITHGTGTATSLAETANRLLGADYAVGINAPLDEKPQQIIAHLQNYLKEAKVASDILFLVDMGSLTNFGAEIEAEFGIKTKTIPLVSTLHVIEATRKAMLGYSLDKVYEATLQVNELLVNQQSSIPTDTEPEKPITLAIATVCTTGEGCANLLKKILEENLKSNYLPLEVIPLSIAGNENITAELKKIATSHQLLCLVSPFHIDSQIAQFGIDEVLNQSALNDMQKLIDIETTYDKIGATFENHLKHIQGRTALEDIKQLIRNIETGLAIRIPTDVLIGIAFHLGCLLDKLCGTGSLEPLKIKPPNIPDNPKLHSLITTECEVLNRKYRITIPKDEMSCMMLLFDPQNFNQASGQGAQK
jgi:transcriptional regulator with AAA-type ATPase domain/transcriptional regulatory protein LevR